MTLKLIDPAAKKEYEQAQERYAERVKELVEDPSKKWPEDLRPPKPPEPFVNNRDPGLDVRRDGQAEPCYPPGYSGTGQRLLTDLPDKDGTAQSPLKGYAVESGKAPFAIKR